MKNKDEKKELKRLSRESRKIFDRIGDIIKEGEITDRTLDIRVLDILRKYEISRKGLEIKFSEPRDEIYTQEGGRTPYDLLCYGKIDGKSFFLFINNKFGRLNSNARNDITTYNNLLRLYLGIKKQRLTSNVIIDKQLIYNRISGKEIVSYGVFVIDRYDRNHNFFLLEEISDNFYVNPRNTMFQVSYNPNIGKIIDYYPFIMKLMDAIIVSLEKNINKTRAEIIALNTVKMQVMEIRNRCKNEW